MSTTKILIVEDETVIALELETRLMHMGYQVLGPVATSAEALHSIPITHPDLVLMDIQLSGEEDGIIAASKIHQAYDIPVIYLTANADVNTLQRAKFTQPIGFLTKPFRERELQATIEMGLYKHEAEAQIRRLAIELEQKVEERTAQLAATNTALSESEQRWQFALEGSNEGVWDWEISTAGVYFSPRWKSLLGYADHEIPNDLHEWRTRIHPDDVARVGAETRRHLKGETPIYQVEMRLQCKDGTYKWILSRGKVMTYDTAGNPARMVGTHTDISALKDLEDALRRSNTELEQYAYMVSHDLQEPLRMITSYTQLLAKRYRGRLDQEADEFINYTVDGTKRMHAMIKGLLEYSRVGRFTEAFKPLASETLWLLAQDNLRLISTEKQAHITHDLLPNVLGHEPLVVQLFQNLLSNALKFCTTTPHIHLSATPPPELSAHPFWTFALQDNGIGIAPENFQRIFVIFQRLHTREEYPGMGLGLALCKRIVERHGGQIWVASKVGQGTTFYFTLPAAPA